jgi:hypothetical protein
MRIRERLCDPARGKRLRRPGSISDSPPPRPGAREEKRVATGARYRPGFSKLEQFRKIGGLTESVSEAAMRVPNGFRGGDERCGSLQPRTAYVRALSRPPVVRLFLVI